MFSRAFQSILLLMFFSASANAGFTVVANLDAGLNEISITELKKLYLKKVPLLPNGKPVIVAGLERGDARNEFIKNVLRRSDASLHAYWSRLMFSGRADPPKLFQTDVELLEYIRRTPGAIGFVDSSVSLGDNVTSVSLH